MQRKNMMGKVGGGSSRSQKGGRCQLHSTQEAKPTTIHRKRSLDPRRVITTFKVDVADGTQDRSKFIIIALETRWREETWRWSLRTTYSRAEVNLDTASTLDAVGILLMILVEHLGGKDCG